jgi:hypothetical protein
LTEHAAMRFAVALDPPGETKRQFWTLIIWLFFLGTAVVLGERVGPRAPEVDAATGDPTADVARAEAHRSRNARFRVALLVGLLAPAFATLLLTRRHRRNGAYPRGITVEVTEAELRIWGRGYGSRVPVAGALLEERLVDVYAGRLGAWRQIRLRVRSRHNTIELAAPARESESADLRLAGGEGDCVELAREDYDALKAEIIRRQATGPGSSPAT